jgi:hypothetical protein
VARAARMPRLVVVRAIGLAVLVSIAAAWGLIYHYAYSPAPMLVPAPPAAVPTYDADAGELPVPDLADP